MTGKLTPKQHKFALAHAALGNATEAYRESYAVKTMSARAVNTEAYRLMQNPQIARTIDQAIRNAGVTVDSICAELEATRVRAHEIDQLGPAVSATMGKAKVGGLLIDRSESVNLELNAADLKPDYDVIFSPESDTQAEHKQTTPAKPLITKA